jgi:hypothetical protein
MLTTRTLAAAATGALVLLVAPSSAFAWDKPGTPPPTTGTGGSGQTITITVTGTGVKGGSAGSPGTTTAVVRSPCSMDPGFTGKEYYDWVSSGDARRLWHQTGSDLDGPFETKPGYEKYKDDDKGHWYGGSCSSEGFEDLKDFFKYSDAWFAAHESVYVPEGVEPPVPPVPPELLRDAASEAMTLPAPEINWNPKRNGDAATLVNIDTWVWLTDRSTNRYVEASAGGVTARVDANLTSMTVSAPNAGRAECRGGGVPYAPGASGECSITFKKGSPAGGTTPVTTQTQWLATWSIDGADQGQIPNQPAPATDVTPIGVREVQAVVNR